jgi:FtsP/CotA-like multicopper oxidase with cupredoxin domain
MTVKVDLKVSQFVPKEWPDGIPKKVGEKGEEGIWGYNEQFAGPTIRAKEGEGITVMVTNDLPEPTTVHWHGMYQRGNWFYDGPSIIQPPILKGSCFKYTFTAQPAGTHWYHAHIGSTPYSEGLFGPLIIEETNNPYKDAYNSEQVVLINDWFHEPSCVILDKLVKGEKETETPKGDSGQGMDMSMPKSDSGQGMDVGDVPFDSALINGKGRCGSAPSSPLETFTITKGDRIRFRIINASSTYAFKFAIDGHQLSVIATDGILTQLHQVDSLVINIGERYDVLVTADQVVQSYWMRAQTLEPNKNNGVCAILNYQGADSSEPKTQPNWGTCLDVLELKPRTPPRLGQPTKTFTLLLSGTMKPYKWCINGQVFQEPKDLNNQTIPITQNDNPPDPPTTQLKVAKDDCVRFILNNETMMNHPFHLHGHSFYVLGVSKPKEAGCYHSGQPLNETDPILKDTLDIPMNGWAVIQWVADNPGWWFFHCHIEWHMATGMALVIREGKPPSPPQNLGQC